MNENSKNEIICKNFAGFFAYKTQLRFVFKVEDFHFVVLTNVTRCIKISNGRGLCLPFSFERDTNIRLFIFARDAIKNFFDDYKLHCVVLLYLMI